MTTAPFDFKIILTDSALPFFENALEEVASAVLTVPIEKGENVGKWELQAIFEEMPDKSMLDFALKMAANKAEIAVPNIILSQMPDKNWLKESYQSFRPILIGKYFIYGSHIDENDIPDEVISLQIDAATAFGTGEHQTTHGCLLALNELDITPKSVLDVGCGSGILSMAYAKTFLKPVDGVDIDEESVRVATLNAEINKLDNLLTFWQSDGYDKVDKQYDLILCNILAQPLVDMAPQLAKHLNKGGRAILSGFLLEQEEWVVSAHIKSGLKTLKSYHIGEWASVVVEK